MTDDHDRTITKTITSCPASSTTTSSKSHTKTTSSKPVPTHSIKSCYKKAALTQYWVPKEGDKDMLNDGTIVTLTGSKKKKLVTDDGKMIAKVSKTTYEKFQMEGTGLLESGILVNLASSDDTFEKVDRKEAPYGLGNTDGSTLTPWISVASNDLKHGTILHIKELDGVELPNGRVHNGCVRVDDEGWSFGGCQLDWFVLQFSAYQTLVDLVPEKVTVTAQDCEIKNYVTEQDKNWAVLH
ncbi:hypothetical protein BDF20DRAFT_902117 [Mycotypha africana]|uniref:uncharacterized protein n=1 Tax=Mycotypha africana TaxID=64632 RepID=UPI0023012D73|nr:uncharacterized protein BDF20DRAFT_902117 [Mycotypha africana]KAI8967168.1 hypothetical protein BDF20DRAFT_902117 [Mycotypha africana]